MNDIGIISLTNGGFALVDSDLFEFLNGWNWFETKKGYIRRSGYGNVHLHELVNCTPRDRLTNHINGFRHDCRRRNLESVTDAENAQYRSKSTGTTSRFKGVSWYPKSQKWMAYIYVNRVRVHLGYFFYEEDAARAYDEAARKFFSKPKLNFPS